VAAALVLAADAGIPLRPSLVSFTPWTTMDDYVAILEFIAEHDLVEQVDPVQYTIRLLVPPGSALLEDLSAHEWLGELDEEAFTYRWQHPDPRMDTLYREVSQLVGQQQQAGRDHRAVYYAVRDLALRIAGRSAPTAEAPPVTGRALPHLTEAWFC
jgi:hypothetical protein